MHMRIETFFIHSFIHILVSRTERGNFAGGGALAIQQHFLANVEIPVHIRARVAQAQAGKLLLDAGSTSRGDRVLDDAGAVGGFNG